MGFRSVVAAANQPMTNSEQRVLKVLLGDEDVSGLTAATVGAKAGTHESTVVRLARKLGYRGYPELRSELQRETEETGTHRPGVMRAGTGWTLEAFARDEARSLERVATFISQTDLDAAAATLERATRVYLFGNSYALPLLHIMDRRLRRLGLAVVVMSSSAKDMAEHFTSFESGCVLVAFALREKPRYLERIAAQAVRRGGRTILITDVPGLAFTPTPDHQLGVPRTADSEYNTLLVPMTLCYALQLAVFHRDAPRFQAVRDDIDDLTRMAGGIDEIPLR